MTDVTEKDGVASGLAEVALARARALGVELIAIGNRSSSACKRSDSPVCGQRIDHASFDNSPRSAERAPQDYLGREDQFRRC